MEAFMEASMCASTKESFQEASEFKEASIETSMYALTNFFF